MFRFALILAALALPVLIADGAEARCVRGAAGCGAGAGHHGARGAPGHHHAHNRNGGVNRVGVRR